MSIQAGIGLSIEKDPRLAAKEAIRQARANLPGENLSLAFAFSTVSLASTGLLKTISASLGNLPVIGCTGAGIISNQGIFKHGLTIMLLSLPKAISFNTACVTQVQEKTCLNAGEELGEKLLSGFGRGRRDLSMIFSDGLIKEGSTLLYGLQEKLGKSFPLVGASASDNLRFIKTFIYFNDELLSDSACAILWGGKLDFGLGVKHGWKPLGKPRYVTAASGNIVYEIDGAPAAKIYEEYLACDLTELRKKLKYISVLYPLGLYLAGEEEYLLRNILSIQDDGSLALQADAPVESMVRLMIGTKESCLAATRQAAEEAKKSLAVNILDSRKKGRVNFVLVFDSISRYILLRRDAQKELEIIRETFGKDTPLAGIYTYGEQAPLKAVSYQGKAYFHNQTVTVLAVRGCE